MKLDELLKHAMELERVQAKIYEGLANKFPFSKEISEFWSGMAEDEKGHYEAESMLFLVETFGFSKIFIL